MGPHGAVGVGERWARSHLRTQGLGFRGFGVSGSKGFKGFKGLGFMGLGVWGLGV